MNIGCLSKIHFGCSVEVIKDHYQVICEIYSVVDKNQKKILKFNENNQKILTNQFPNMMQNLEENKIVMKKIKKDKNYNSDALAQNVKRKYKSSIYSPSFILLKYTRNTLALLYFIKLTKKSIIILAIILNRKPIDYK